MRRRIAGNLVWLLLDRGLQVVAGICIVAMLARALGAEGFAHFQYAQSLVYIGASVALICGSEVVIPRLVASPDPGFQHRLLVHVFRLRFAAACAGYLLICSFLLASGQPRESWLAALILGIAILLREPFGVVTAWMQAHTRNRPGTVFNLIALAIKAGTVALLLASDAHTAPPYAVAFALEPVVIVLCLVLFYRSQTSTGSVAHDPDLMRHLFNEGTLFWISFMMMVGARRIDQLILKPIVPLGELGAYAASMQILDNYVAIATILVAGIAPLYVYSQNDVRKMRLNVLKLTAAMTALGMAGSVVIALMAPWIIHLLYGSAFASAADLLRLSALASSLVFTDVGLSVLAVYLRKPTWIAIKWALVLAVTVAVDFLTIPRLGARGAILGYALANALAAACGAVMWLRVARSGEARP